MLLIGAALLTAMVWKPAPPAQFHGLTDADVPRTIGGYAATQDVPLDPVVKQALSSADVVERNYGAGPDATDFLVIGGTDRTALHDPRSCLVGAGWRLEDDHTERLPGTTVDARTCHAVGQAGSTGFDMLYLYVVNGRVINQVTQIRAAMLWSALLGRKNTPVYFVRVMRPLPAEEGAKAGQHAQMLSFASEAWKTLAPRLTGTQSSQAASVPPTVVASDQEKGS